MNNKNSFRSGLILLIALFIAALIAYGQIVADTVPSTTQIAGSSVGGPFALIDHTGKPFTDQNLLGHYTIAYFGFTFCPAICPMELQKMNLILKNLGPLAEKVHTLFITVDPERDTQKVMAAYVAQFNPGLTGLTGTPAQIDGILKAYHVYARKVEDSKMSDYTVDHSSYFYLIGADGKVVSFYGPDSTATQIANDIKTMITH